MEDKGIFFQFSEAYVHSHDEEESAESRRDLYLLDLTKLRIFFIDKFISWEQALNEEILG